SCMVNVAQRPLSSFPTRRSSDLGRCCFQPAVGDAHRAVVWIVAQVRGYKREIGQGPVLQVCGEPRERNGLLGLVRVSPDGGQVEDRKSKRLDFRHVALSYAVVWL